MSFVDGWLSLNFTVDDDANMMSAGYWLMMPSEAYTRLRATYARSLLLLKSASLPPKVNDAMRTTGCLSVLSISGNFPDS